MPPIKIAPVSIGAAGTTAATSHFAIGSAAPIGAPTAAEVRATVPITVKPTGPSASGPSVPTTVKPTGPSVAGPSAPPKAGLGLRPRKPMPAAKTGGIPRKAPISSIAARKGRKAPAGVQKKRRYRPGTVALREIRKYQRTTDLLLPKTVFIRLVREITESLGESYRFQKMALEALQEAAEHYIIQTLEGSNHLAIHAKRVTVMEKDMKLLQRIRGWFGN